MPWEEYDKSVLPVKVVAKSGPTTATIYMAYINKDNMSRTLRDCQLSSFFRSGSSIWRFACRVTAYSCRYTSTAYPSR